MPGLLDLPPELLENVAQYLLQPSDLAHLASLRLSCRQIEDAIRPAFRQEYFRSVTIGHPKTTDVEKFCAIAKTSDLAKSIRRLVIRCADDGTTKDDAQHRVPQPGETPTSNDGRELSRSSGPDRIVPTTFIGHKEALVAAFLATVNVTELEFTDYHRPSLATDGSVWEHPDHPPPRRMQRRAAAVNDPGEFVCDISSTFNFVISLVARAGLTPKFVTMHSLVAEKLVTGLSSAIGLATWKQALLQLEPLDLVFVDDFRDESDLGEAA